MSTKHRVPPLEILLTCAECETDFYGSEIPGDWHDIQEEEYSADLDVVDLEPRYETRPDGSEVWHDPTFRSPFWTHIGVCAECFAKRGELF